MKTLSGFISLAFLLTGVSVAAQTTDEIIQKYCEARGGLDKVKALKTMTAEGSLVQSGTEITLKFYYLNNTATKVEYSVMGQTGYNILTTTAGWTYNPFAGMSAAEPMPEEQVKDAQSQLDLQGPLVDYQAKGNKVEYMGKENLQGTDYYKLQVTSATGKISTYYLDKDYLLVRLKSTALVNGSETEITTEYSDYRKTPEGYVFAFRRSTPNGEINFEKIEINPTIDEAVFKPSN